MLNCWKALLGDPDDPNQKLRVTRLKNKLGKGKEPFNFHVNARFQPEWKSKLGGRRGVS